MNVKQNEIIDLLVTSCNGRFTWELAEIYVLCYPKESRQLSEAIKRDDLDIERKIDTSVAVAEKLMKDKVKRVVSLPDRLGNWNLVKLPNYVSGAILSYCRDGLYRPKIKETSSPYVYRMDGASSDRNRKDYGLLNDFKKIQKWVTKHWPYATCELKYIHRERKNYYLMFELSDPVALGLEKAGLIWIN